jgi:hypothetical protein
MVEGQVHRKRESDATLTEKTDPGSSTLDRNALNWLILACWYKLAVSTTYLHFWLVNILAQYSMPLEHEIYGY